MFYNIILFIFFYMWAMAALVFEWWVIYPDNYKKLLKYNERVKEDNKIKKGTKLSIKECFFSLFVLGYLLWILVGLFTSQWLFFAGLLFLSVISTTVRKTKKMTFTWNLIDSILTIGLLLCIIVNKYSVHASNLKIWKDIWKWLVHLFD